jgi:hypothetical protein
LFLNSLLADVGPSLIYETSFLYKPLVTPRQAGRANSRGSCGPITGFKVPQSSCTVRSESQLPDDNIDNDVPNSLLGLAVAHSLATSISSALCSSEFSALVEFACMLYYCPFSSSVVSLLWIVFTCSLCITWKWKLVLSLYYPLVIDSCTRLI